MIRNKKFAANANIFGKVEKKMNEKAAADGGKNTITHSQVGNNKVNKVKLTDSVWD